MDRRSFLKNSIFALLATSISSNKVLAGVAETLTPSSTKVLLYLIQNKKGYWFVRGTKWIDIAKTKINEEKYNIDTFKPLDIVDNTIADDRRLQLWKENNCGGGPGGGTCFKLDVEKSANSVKIAVNSEGFRAYVNSDLKKINASIHGKLLAERGIAQKNLLKILDLPIEKKLESYKKSAQSRTGRKASADHCFAISNSLKGKRKSDEHINNMSLSRIGKKVSEETKRKISITISGAGNPMFGKTHTEEAKKKIANNPAYKIERTCPHCSKTIIGTNYFRHHGDRCKIKNLIPQI
jgi:hypothetical protein